MIETQPSLGRREDRGANYQHRNPTNNEYSFSHSFVSLLLLTTN
jgi:hypothetical protein